MSNDILRAKVVCGQKRPAQTQTLRFTRKNKGEIIVGIEARVVQVQ